MAPATPSLETPKLGDAERINRRAGELFAANCDQVRRDTDRVFATLLLVQWLVCVGVAAMVSPQTWEGLTSRVHPHVWLAAVIGGLAALFPAWLARTSPGRPLTRHAIAVGQTMISALLIHLTGGRIETHFHIFGSLAFLAFYRDWRVLVTASVVIAADHLLRGIYWPQSVFGVLSASPLRAVEHAGWVLFEDTFLLLGIQHGLRDMFAAAERLANLEALNGSIEQIIRVRTAELSRVNETLTKEVDERLRVEAEIQRALDAAQAASRTKDSFLAAMSHELRTPLNAILGFNELLLEGIQGELNEKQAKSLRAVDESARHLLSLINDILDLSKIEAGQERLSIECTALEPVCQASVRFVRQLAAKKQLTVVTEVDPRLETLPADERRLRQILINLLSNAVKFTPEGGRVGLEVGPEAGENMIRFTVWDTGIGIPEADRAKLFQPFVQLDSRLSRQYSGTGLGLSLVRRLAELHGGRVTLESEPGKGSRFSVFLPGHVASEVVAAVAPAPPSEANFAGLRQSRPAVLLVEDNAMNQETVEAYLTSCGCRVTIAKDGFEGLTVAARLRPDVVLMDVQMPGMDGLEAMRRLKRAPETASIPVIALTALAMNGDRQNCLTAGADDYLTKPVNLKQLAALIEQLVSARRPNSS